MNKDREYLTKEKQVELIAELEELKTVRRRAVAERLEFAKSMGDLTENAEYHAAREEQAEIEGRIAQLESILKTSTIVTSHHSSRVEIGSRLLVQREGGEHGALTFTVVGSEEADVKKGKISYQSPLGEALLGKAPGETVAVSTPSGEVRYTIQKIE